MREKWQDVAQDCWDDYRCKFLIYILLLYIRPVNLACYNGARWMRIFSEDIFAREKSLKEDLFRMAYSKVSF